jgi:hypothetical protein
MFMDTVTNILKKETPLQNCDQTQHTYFRLNHTLYQFNWQNQSYQQVNVGDTELIQKALYQHVVYSESKFTIFRERIGLFPIMDIYNTGANLLDDFVQTVQRERRQLRELEIWPNSSRTDGISTAFTIGGQGLFGWIQAGFDRLFKI